MRRSGHPSRPRAITCCFFSSLKTLLIPTKATALRRNQRPRASFSLAGFQVTLIGRFWVTAEADLIPCCYFFEAFDSLGYLRRRAFGFLGFGKKACSLYPQLVNLAPQRIGRNGNYAA